MSARKRSRVPMLTYVPNAGRAPGPKAHPLEKLAFARFRKSPAHKKRLLDQASRLIAGRYMDDGLALLRGCVRASGGFEVAAMLGGYGALQLRNAFRAGGAPTHGQFMAVFAVLNLVDSSLEVSY